MSRKILVGVIGAIIVIIIAGLVFINLNHQREDMDALLDLGNRYLSEGEYTEAIMVFENV